MAVASPGLYASLHLTQTDNHTSTSPLSVLQAGCPSCRPTNSVKALKAQVVMFAKSEEVNKYTRKHLPSAPVHVERSIVIQNTTSKPALASTSKNWRILLVQSFTTCMPLLMATSAFRLGRRCWSPPNSVIYTVSIL